MKLIKRLAVVALWFLILGCQEQEGINITGTIHQVVPQGKSKKHGMKVCQDKDLPGILVVNSNESCPKGSKEIKFNREASKCRDINSREIPCR